MIIPLKVWFVKRSNSVCYHNAWTSIKSSIFYYFDNNFLYDIIILLINSLDNKVQYFKRSISKLKIKSYFEKKIMSLHNFETILYRLWWINNLFIKFWNTTSVHVRLFYRLISELYFYGFCHLCSFEATLFSNVSLCTFIRSE